MDMALERGSGTDRLDQRGYLRLNNNGENITGDEDSRVRVRRDARNLGAIDYDATCLSNHAPIHDEGILTYASERDISHPL
jgi:hypothetical protein